MLLKDKAFLADVEENGHHRTRECVKLSDALRETRQIRLDDQTVIRVGYDECDINDGVVPNTVLAAGVINKDYKLTDEVEEISFVVISDFPLQRQ